VLAAKLLETSVLQGDRLTIDVSGDGPNNIGPSFKPVREALIARGVTINGLAISLPAHDVPQRFEYFGQHYVQSYYEGCVIGGPGAFVVAVDGASEFKQAIRRKLLTEIAGAPVGLQRAEYDTRYPPVSDCRALGESTRRLCRSWATAECSSSTLGFRKWVDYLGRSTAILRASIAQPDRCSSASRRGR
jgi:Protein of unknown function (DUF1194)